MTRDLATVDVQDFAGDERGEFEEEYAVDDVTDLAQATERVKAGEPIISGSAIGVTVDDAQRDCVDPDAARGVLDGE